MQGILFYSAGVINWANAWPIVMCVVIGVALLIIEMFTPGFGAAGIAGIAALLVAIVLKAKTLQEALWLTLLLMAIIGVLLLIFMRSATKGAVSKSKLILHDKLNAQAGFISNEDLSFFVSKTGRTIMPLRPAGMAEFDGVKLDVVSDGEFIPAGATVRVENVEGRRIVVRQVADSEPCAESGPTVSEYENLS